MPYLSICAVTLFIISPSGSCYGSGFEFCQRAGCQEKEGLMDSRRFFGKGIQERGKKLCAYRISALHNVNRRLKHLESRLRHHRNSPVVDSIRNLNEGNRIEKNEKNCNRIAGMPKRRPDGVQASFWHVGYLLCTYFFIFPFSKPGLSGGVDEMWKIKSFLPFGLGIDTTSVGFVMIWVTIIPGEGAISST